MNLRNKRYGCSQYSTQDINVKILRYCEGLTFIMTFEKIPIITCHGVARRGKFAELLN